MEFFDSPGMYKKGLFSGMQYGFEEGPSIYIIFLSGEAKSSAAFLMSVRPSASYGLRVYCINCFQSLESGAECGWH